MTYEIFVFVVTVSFLAMVSPGPDFFLVVKNSLSYPRSYALMTTVGIISAVVVHMFYCVAGIAVIITTTPWLFTLLRYAGAAYLIWIGIKALFAKSSGTTYVQANEQQIQISHYKAFMQGFLCNLLNPKATLFFLAVFTQVLAIDSLFLDKLWVATIIWVEAAIWWPLVVFIFQSSAIQRRYFKLQLVIDKLLGIILIALGIKVALGL